MSSMILRPRDGPNLPAIEASPLTNKKVLRRLRQYKCLTSSLRLQAACRLGDRNSCKISVDEILDVADSPQHLPIYTIAADHNIIIRGAFSEKGATATIYVGHLVENFGFYAKRTSEQTVKEVAMKVVESCSHDRKVEKLPRELEVWKKLDHPNVVKLVDFFATAIHPILREFYISDFYGGPNLKLYQQLHGSEFDEDRIKLITAQICKGLRHVHDRRIAHRDLKLANIFVRTSPEFRLAIGDFGSAIEMPGEDVSQLSDIPSFTPVYSPPEVSVKIAADGKRKKEIYDPFKLDVWSLGVCVFVLRFGKFPFDMKKMVNEGVAELKKPMVTEPIAEFLQQIFVTPYTKRPLIDKIMNLPWLKEFKSDFDQDLRNYSTLRATS